MKLKLKSNFFEPFHCAFDSEGIEFRIVTTDGPDRPAMFNMFKKVGLKTPINGYYDTFVKNKYENERKVVVYDDIRSHFGENKRLLQFSELNVEDKLKYMSEYINFEPKLFTDYISKSTRYLFVGDYGFSYDYYSYNDWRSNNGRVHISEPHRLDLPKWRKEIPYAFFAIDFVGESYDLRAIDFNCAPGVYGVKLGMSSAQMVLAIKEWLKKYVTQEEN